jgi:hypothetical protein
MKEMDAKALAEKEDRLRRIYGNLPTRGNLVHHQLEVSSTLNNFLNPADQLSCIEEVFRFW